MLYQHLSNVVFMVDDRMMLVQRRSWWANIVPTLDKRLMFLVLSKTLYNKMINLRISPYKCV